MSILLICMDTARARAVHVSAERALARGHEVFLVTGEAASWAGLDPRVRVVGLGGIQAREPVVRGERLVLFRIPRKIFSVVLAVLGAPAGTALSRIADPVARGVRRAAATYEAAATAAHRRVFLPAYRRVQPRLVEAASRRAVAARVDLTAVQQVVVQDGGGLVVADLLVRSRPTLNVGFELAEAATAA